MNKPSVCIVFMLLVANTVSPQETIRLSFITSNAMPVIGFYSPQLLELSATKPTSLSRAPVGLTAPLYGILPVQSSGSRRFHVVVDEPDGADAVLYVDANGDGDMTNDPPAQWTPHTNAQGFRSYTGGATLALAAGSATVEAHLGMYRFDKKDPGYGTLKSTLLYYRDYAAKGEMRLGAKTYRVVLSDEKASGNFRDKEARLLIDLNGDGRFTIPRESFDPSAAFNIGGTTYEVTDITPLGDSLRLMKSSKAVTETLPPPDHAVGNTITAFQAKDMDGRQVRFPADYAGKVVMLDFWATWCGPCMEEVPGLASTYAKYYAKGFEVLGVTLDAPNQADKIRSTMKEKGMRWRQVYDGKQWSAEIALLYVVNAIPAAYLVDGDTGEILAAGDSLRGAALPPTVEKALRKKGKL
jgi:thiol-disulfide isomerase/thioredoxin